MNVSFLRGSRILGAVGACALVMLSCGGGEDGEQTSAASFNKPFENAKAYPVLATSEVVVGRNRFILGLLDAGDAPIGAPEIHVGLRFYDLTSGSPRPAGHSDTEYVSSIEGGRGVYVANPDFPHPGKWGAEVSINGMGLDETVRISFDVAASSNSVPLGEVAPASVTPTVRDVKRLSQITTDTHPDPAFYRFSIDEALEAKEPLVVVFATPKFCQSAVCGPTLDVVQRVAKDFPNVNFIHVEFYKNLDDPSNLKPVRAVYEWGLPSEPWVFVVGSDDKVTAKYEGVVGTNELRRQLASLEG